MRYLKRMNGQGSRHKQILDENLRLRRQAEEALELARTVQEELNYIRAQIGLRTFLGVDERTADFIRNLDPACIKAIDH